MPVDQDLRRQMKLQDEMDHITRMGNLPPVDKLKQIRDYESKTGIIIRNPYPKPGTSTRFINSECPEGYVFVTSYKKRDGTFVRAFCRRRDIDMEIPERYAYKEDY